VMLQAGGVAETVQVVAEAPAAIQNPVVGENFQHDEIEALATPRALEGIAQLAPGLSENSPSATQVVINGAFAFDNIFMVNGIDIDDNLRAQPQNLFVEDAIQETQVLTSAISAEYGRFTGGVVNAITRSGGNVPSGSLRINFLNPAWTDETPYEKTSRLDELQQTYEATFGGPIVRDQLWFFLSGRYENTDSSRTLPVTAIPYTQNLNNKRGEIKLTGTVAPDQTVQGGYFNNGTTTTNGSGALSLLIDPHSLDVVPVPNWYAFATYRGVVGKKLLAQVQYSERRFTTGGGNTATALVDSPMIAGALSGAQPFGVYNAPYFDASDQEQRNNRQFTANATGFWDKAGHHELKVGYEFFRSQRSGGGSQSSTTYVFYTDWAASANGSPAYDSNGYLIPLFTPGLTAIDFAPATRGAVLNVDNNSLFVQDHWAINSRWSADLGMRYERVKAVSTGDIVSVDNNRIVPRLGIAFDPKGNGDHVIHATYAMYSGRYNEAQIAQNTSVAHAPELLTFYRGPRGQGRDFAAGFDLANYPSSQQNSFVLTAPPTSVFNDPGLKSPLVHEFTTSYGVNLWQGRGYADVSYIFRKTTGLIEDFQTVSNGFTEVVLEGVSAGLATNKVFKNTDLAHREYQGLVFQSQYRISDRWSVNGHYTVQLKNEGNYEGETGAVPGATSIIGNYPEAFNAARSYPDGWLQNSDHHRLRLWSTYDFRMGRFGDLSVSGLWRVESGRVYSHTAVVPLTATQAALLSAYPDPPPNSTVFFGDRGSQSFKGYGLFDASVNYDVPVFRSLRPWIKLDLFNVLNNDKLISWNTTVKADPNSPKDSLGLPTGYLPGALYGQATSTGNFPVPFNGATGGRTFRMAVGIRF
jgi:hypothetical protein